MHESTNHGGFKTKPTGRNIIQIFGRQGKGFAYAGPDSVDPAALVLSVMGRALPAAFAAPNTLSAPFSLPRQNLLFLQVPDNSSSNPSV